MLEAGGLPSQGVGGRRVSVWEQSGEELMAWVLVLQYTGWVTADEKTNNLNVLFMGLFSVSPFCTSIQRVQQHKTSFHLKLNSTEEVNIECVTLHTEMVQADTFIMLNELL